MNSREYMKESRSQLAFHQTLACRFRRASESLPGMSLICRRIGGKPRYYYRKEGSPRQHYLGQKDPVLLQKLLMKRVAVKSLPAVEKNIHLLETLLLQFKCIENVYEPEPPVAPQPQPFPAGTENHPEEKKYLTSSGLRVRSRAEAIIVEMLNGLSIPFYYEKPLRIRGADGRWRTVYPDFTYCLPDGREKYHEHFGMMNDEKYRNKNLQKLADYFANGIYPPHNLIITMDGPDGELDIAAIHQLLQALILPHFQGAASPESR